MREDNLKKQKLNNLTIEDFNNFIQAKDYNQQLEIIKKHSKQNKERLKNRKIRSK